MAVNDDMNDAFTIHAVDLLRVEAGIRTEVLFTLGSMMEELAEEIRNEDVAAWAAKHFGKSKRQEALIEQARRTIDSAYRGMDETLADELLDLAEAESVAIPKIINEVVDADIASVTWTKKDLETLAFDALIDGAPSRDWWAEQSRRTQHRFATEVRNGVLRGESNDDIVRRVRGKATGKTRIIKAAGKTRRVREFKGGIMDVSTREAEALVRTSVQTVSGIVMNKTYEENGDVLRGRQLQATLDARTTVLCRALSGGAWDLEGNPLPDSPVQRPFPGFTPLHWNCRSFYIPLTKSWEELSGIKGLEEPPVSTQASMDGQVAGTLTYEQWLKGKSERFQKKVLGEERWDLWNRGKVTVEQMIDQNLNPMTVARLRAKYDKKRRTT